MRTYIFTSAELNAIQEWLESGRRNPTVNKILHNIRRSGRLLEDIEILLILHEAARKKRRKEKPKMMPGRPPKLFKTLPRGG